MAGKGKSTGHPFPLELGTRSLTSVQSARLSEALVVTAQRIFLHLTMSIQCGPLTESWDLRTGKKPRRASTKISDAALPSEPRAARKKIKSEDASQEHQFDTRSSTKPRRMAATTPSPPPQRETTRAATRPSPPPRETTMAATMPIPPPRRETTRAATRPNPPPPETTMAATMPSPPPRPETTMAATMPSPPPRPETTMAATMPIPPPPRPRRTSLRTYHCLAVVQTVITYVVGVMTFCALVMMWQRLGWGSLRPTHPPWNVLSSHNPALPKFEVDYIVAACRPSHYPDCVDIPAMLYQLNGDLTQTNWAIETLGYRLGDALSKMTDPSSKSDCSYLRHLQSDFGMVQKYGDGVRAAVATAALEEEAILSLVTLVGLDVAYDLKVLLKEVNTGGSWTDILLDSDAPHRRERQWRECAKCQNAMESCVGDLGKGIEILAQEAERYTQLEKSLDEIGKQIKATLVAAEEEGENGRCTRDMLQRIQQYFTQAIVRVVDGDLLSLKPPQ